ncbi:RILP-like protein homolog isoform X2 [Portunus trituberculatus]|uniref:RILP-like protein homolog isoform X2 n=1 Tax=Portunus trituberculatus TaxID=210409 RepID=UPI001E1CF1BC|nr:RILP-like protein homolog isoform X2 [Portunus trituberculatus]
MPYQIEAERDMEEEEVRISVVDVYDLASEIGKEFEKIIDRTGAEAVTGLMPRVISALEYLEKLAMRHENTSAYIQELRASITHLENEKIGKAEDRQRYERELEDIEDRLREESHELVAMVARLQDENRKLSSSLAKTEGTLIHSNGATPEVDLKVVTQLQEVIESQREQLHKTEKEAHQKAADVENLKSQLEKVNHINRELRRRQRTSVSQMRSLIDERAELQAALQEESRAVSVLRQRLGLAQKENEDLSISSSDSQDLSNKLVYDRDDPNRPRFTMTELKEILYERNELKARVSDLEDELEMYRPRDQRPRSHILCPPLDEEEERRGEEEGGAGGSLLSSASSSFTLPTPPPSLSDPLSSPPLAGARTHAHARSQEVVEDEEEDDGEDNSDPPVQGPMPYEPDDAPWKKEESGIRKFFRRLFGEENTANTTHTTTTTTTGASTSPKRTLLSLHRP